MRWKVGVGKVVKKRGEQNEREMGIKMEASQGKVCADRILNKDFLWETRAIRMTGFFWIYIWKASEDHHPKALILSSAMPIRVRWVALLEQNEWPTISFGKIDWRMAINQKQVGIDPSACAHDQGQYCRCHHRIVSTVVDRQSQQMYLELDSATLKLRSQWIWAPWGSRNPKTPSKFS
jgi:hypothetical protein